MAKYIYWLQTPGHMDFHVFSVATAETKGMCLSVLPKKIVEDKRLHNKAIVGFLKTDQVNPQDFVESQAFKDYFHQFISRQLPLQAEFLSEGKKINNGYVYLIDKRTKNPKGDVPMQDIVGAMNFENGHLVADSYLPNKNYKLLTSKGLFQLPFSLEESFLKEIVQQ